MIVRNDDGIAIHRIRSQEDRAHWRAGFVDAYQSIFAAPPYSERFYPAEAEAVYDKLCTTPGHIVLVAADGDTVAGFAAAIPLREKYVVARELSGLVPLPHTMYLAELGVMPDYRLRGLGRILTMERLRFVDRDAFSHVVLRVSTATDGSTPMSMYQSLGFTEMGVYMEVSAMRVDGRVKTDRRLFLSKVLSQVPIDEP